MRLATKIKFSPRLAKALAASIPIYELAPLITTYFLLSFIKYAPKIPKLPLKLP